MLDQLDFIAFMLLKGWNLFEFDDSDHFNAIKKAYIKAPKPAVRLISSRGSSSESVPLDSHVKPGLSDWQVDVAARCLLVFTLADVFVERFGVGLRFSSGEWNWRILFRC